MRQLQEHELLQVAGGAPANPSMPRTKPQVALNGNGKAIGWCYGFGNLKDESKHGVVGCSSPAS